MDSFPSRYSFEDTDMPSGGHTRVERSPAPRAIVESGAPRKRDAPHNKMIRCAHDCAYRTSRVIRNTAE